MPGTEAGQNGRMTVPSGSPAAPSTPASRRRRRALAAALVVAVVVQLVVLYLPGEQVPEAGFAVPGLDKAIHVAVFALRLKLPAEGVRITWIAPAQPLSGTSV